MVLWKVTLVSYVWPLGPQLVALSRKVVKPHWKKRIIKRDGPWARTYFLRGAMWRVTQPPALVTMASLLLSLGWPLFPWNYRLKQTLCSLQQQEKNQGRSITSKDSLHSADVSFFAMRTETLISWKFILILRIIFCAFQKVFTYPCFLDVFGL